jgi:hypothetical protein
VREAEQSIGKARTALEVVGMNYLPDVNLLGSWANQTGASYIQPNIGFMGATAIWTLWEWGKRRDLARQRCADIALVQQNVQVTVSAPTPSQELPRRGRCAGLRRHCSAPCFTEGVGHPRDGHDSAAPVGEDHRLRGHVSRGLTEGIITSFPFTFTVRCPRRGHRPHVLLQR